MVLRNLVNSKLRRLDINSKVKTRAGVGWLRMFLLTGPVFVSWEIAKVLNYALFGEAVSGLGEMHLLFVCFAIYATRQNK